MAKTSINESTCFGRLYKVVRVNVRLYKVAKNRVNVFGRLYKVAKTSRQPVLVGYIKWRKTLSQRVLVGYIKLLKHRVNVFW